MPQISPLPTAPTPAPADAAAERLAHFRAHPDGIEARLAELDEEWDIERVLELNAVAVSAVGIGLSMLRRRPMLGLPATVAAFVLQHALRGARPPETLLRRLGLRSAAEIAGERAALRALRGEAMAAEPARRAPLAEAVARKGFSVLGTLRR